MNTVLQSASQRALRHVGPEVELLGGVLDARDVWTYAVTCGASIESR